MSSNAEISVVVFVDHHNSALEPTLGAYMKQTCDNSAFEIIIVDSVEGPDSTSIVERAREAASPALQIKYFRLDNSSRPFRNNFGVRQASCKLIAFLSGDFIPEPQLVEAHLAFHRAHRDTEFVGIGPNRSPPEQREASPFLAWAEDSGRQFSVQFASEEIRLPHNFFYVGNASMKKDFFLTVGMFDEDFHYDAWDDLEFRVRATRYGMRTRYVSDAMAIHNHLVTFSERKMRAGWAGESAAIFHSKHPDHGDSIQNWIAHWLCRTVPGCVLQPFFRVGRRFFAWCYVATHQRQFRIWFWKCALREAFLDGYYRTRQHLAER